uniref:Uncharacterized protein n=1 Tax=Naja naja TaxID=35670 RepID=A0A8C6VI57_NAJNA
VGSQRLQGASGSGLPGHSSSPTGIDGNYSLNLCCQCVCQYVQDIGFIKVRERAAV